MDNVFERFGLKINELKTETMIVNCTEPDYPKSIISLRNIPIKNVEKFKYLGAFTKYDQPNTGDVELSYRIQTAVSKFVEMSTLLQNVKINLKTRITFFNMFIRSRLTYSRQNWNLTAHQYERIDVTYRNLLRRMVRGGFNRVSENDYRVAAEAQFVKPDCPQVGLSFTCFCRCYLVVYFFICLSIV